MSLLQSTERREFLRSAFAIVGTLIVTPSHSSDWDQIAYNKTRIVDSIKSVGIDDFSNIVDGSDLIELNTPEIAENGAIVPITIQSQIPQTERIFVFSEKILNRWCQTMFSPQRSRPTSRHASKWRKHPMFTFWFWPMENFIGPPKKSKSPSVAVGKSRSDHGKDRTF